MGNDADEFKEEQKRLELLIASENLFTRADALAEMVNLLANEAAMPAQARLPYILAAIDLNLELKREVELAGNYWSLSDAYYEQKRFEEAIEALELSIDYSRSSGDESSLPMTMNNLGNIFNEKDDPANAIKWYQQGLEASLEQRQSAQAAQALMRLTRIHMSQEDWDEALHCATEAYEIFRADDATVGMIDAKLQQLWCYLLRDEHYGQGGADLVEHLAALLDLVNLPNMAEAHKVLSCWHEIKWGKATQGTLTNLDALLLESRNRNDAVASTVINYVRAKFFAQFRDYRPAISILESLLKSAESIDSRISKSRIFHDLCRAQASAGLHLDAAETAVEFAKYCQQIEDSEDELYCYGLAGEQYLEAGMPNQAVEYLELHHKNFYGKDINQDFKPGTLLARAYLGAERFTEALMLVNDLDARLAIYPASVSDEYPFNLHKDDPMIPWMPARLHELKLDILVAMGDSERAQIEAQFCKEAYESIEDLDSAARMYQTLKSLRKSSSNTSLNTAEKATSTFNFFGEVR